MDQRSAINIFKSVIFSLFLVLSGCNSGGGGGVVVVPTGEITGSVGGTTVIAVDANGNIIASDSTAGREKDVDTDGDRMPDAYSFSLRNIPIEQNNASIRIYTISGGNILPVFFGNSNTNVISLLSGVTIDLGFIDEILSEGKSVSQNDPTDDPGITAGPPDTVIPIGINTPPTAGLSLTELIDQGIDALGDGWMLGARTYFEAAVTEAGAITSNDADTARFLFALTRFLALGFDVQSDGNFVDMNRLGDLLDRLGVANDVMRANWDLIEQPNPLPADSPTGNEYRDFLYDVVRPELIGAVDNFDAISPDFNTVWTFDSVEEVENDYGDVLFLRGVFKIFLTYIATQKAYNLDADVDDIASNGTTTEAFLNDNPGFMGLDDATKLTEAKGYLTMSALDDFDAAIDEIGAEIDAQDNDLVTLDALQDPVGAQDRLAEIKDSILNGATVVGGSTLDLKQFFNTGVDFRSPSSLFPPIAGNDVTGLFPDRTFDGVVLLPDLNEDVFPADGIPDILQ